MFCGAAGTFSTGLLNPTPKPGISMKPFRRGEVAEAGFLDSPNRMRRDTTTEKLASRVEGEGCEVAKRPPPFPRDIKRDLPPPPNGASIKILSSKLLNIWSNFCTNISVHEIMI